MAKVTDWVVSTKRIEAFSDAVFAIAITLLALQLSLPPTFPSSPTDQQLLTALKEELPSYFTLILSFIVIGRYWLAHHALFDRIGKADIGLASLNLWVLLTIVAIPFPTEVLGDYGDLAIASVFYAVSISLVGLVMFALWRHAVRNKLTAPGLTKEQLRTTGRRSLIVPGVFLASVPILLIDVTAGQLFWLLALVISLFMKND